MTAIAVQLGLDRFFAVITAVLLRLGDLAAAGRMRALSFLLRFYVCHTPSTTKNSLSAMGVDRDQSDWSI
jgi:hypothetical protein